MAVFLWKCGLTQNLMIISGYIVSGNERTFMNRDAKRENARRIAVQAVIVVICAAVSSAGGYCAKQNDMPIVMDGMGMVIAGALCGYIPGIICVFLSFTYKIIQDPMMGYVIFLYMIASILASWFARHKWFQSIRKACFAAAILTLVTGASNALITDITMGSGINTQVWKNVCTGYLREVAECFAASIIVYCLFRYIPEKCKRYIPNAVWYSRDETFIKYIEEKLKERSALSARLTAITSIEATLLALSAAYVANLLIGNMNFQNTSFMQNTEPLNTVSQTSIFKNEPISMNGVFNNANLNFKSSLAFDIRLIMILATISVLIAAIINYYAQRRIASPIKKMSKAMSSFAYSTEEKRIEGVTNIHELNIRTHDEIEDLYQAIDTTVDDFTGYIEKIKQDEKLESDLRVAEAASESKSNFLSSMSHEIRTPINAVLGLDEMIIRECDDPDIVQYAIDIQNSGKTLLGLVNDILDFSKIEAGRMEIIPVEYELSSVVNDLINMISVKVREKGLELKVDIDENTPHLLYGDEIRIKQVILNILTNAVKYTETGSIDFSMGFEKKDEDNIMLNVRVTDTGIGIKQQDLEKLFSPFERIEEERNRTIEGTGLGMSITKQLLDMMDSKLIVKSEYGKGSDFSFSVCQRVTKWEAIGNFSEAYEKYVAHSEKYHESFHAPEAHILIVDDTKMNLTVICGLLKATKINIDTAESGKETLDMVCRKKYDVIFIDHRMPDMDGVETFHAMQTLSGNLNKGVPCIALTANAISGAREGYIKEGFSDYMSKPVDGIKLERLLINYLPKDLVVLTDCTGTDSDRKKAGAEDADSTEEKRHLWKYCEGIDAGTAIKNCGSEDMAEEVLKEFYQAIPAESDVIEDFFMKKDYHDYAVKVHALKSSARLIGAMQLSEDAKYLEECGDNKDETAIKEKTPALLELYRSYRDRLGKFFGEDKKENDDRPVMDEAQFNEAVAAISEFAEAFDFDSVDSVIKTIDEYRIPEEYASKYENIRRMAANVDREGILELTKKNKEVRI